MPPRKRSKLAFSRKRAPIFRRLISPGQTALLLQAWRPFQDWTRSPTHSRETTAAFRHKRAALPLLAGDFRRDHEHGRLLSLHEPSPESAETKPRQARPQRGMERWRQGHVPEAGSDGFPLPPRVFAWACRERIH